MTPMQESFGINMLAIVDGRPQTLSLKQALQHFIQHRRDVVTRRTQFDLQRPRPTCTSSRASRSPLTTSMRSST